MRILLFLTLILIAETTVWSQIKITGTVLDKTNSSPLPGVTITEAKTRNKVISGINGEFQITLKNYHSNMTFEYLGYLTQIISVDSFKTTANIVNLEIDDESLEEIIIIAPNPPYLELGYLGLMANQPYGIHAEYSTWGDKFRCYLNYTTNLESSSFVAAQIGPIRNGKSKAYNIFNPFVRYYGMIESNEPINLIFLNNQFYFDRIGAIKLGVGIEQSNNSETGTSFLLGYRLHFQRAGFLNSYVEADAILTQSGLGWESKLYFELYNKEYKNLSFGVGHLRIFEQSALVVNLNYKHYFLKRNNEN
ncbi:MAG: carboxypeptidase-like regulatory domain-containing protein [Cyclobacteriaceae bacterium]